MLRDNRAALRTLHASRLVGSREHRTARLQVRGINATLRGPSRPGGRVPDRVLNAVQARETGIAPGQAARF